MKKGFKKIRRSGSLFAQIVLLVAMGLVTITSHAQKTSCNTKTADTQKAQSKEMSTRVWSGNFQSVKEMIEKDKNMVNVHFNHKNTPLLIASYCGYNDMIELLLSKGADLMAKDEWGYNALSKACFNGKPKTAKLLIEKGIDVNLVGGANETPLHIAARSESVDLVELLIKKGAKIDAKTSQGQTPIIMASWFARPQIIKTLVSHGASVNDVSNEKQSVLHNVARNGNVETLKFLLDKGANANALNKDGKLPIHSAVANSQPEAVKILAKHTKKLNTKESYFGNTALHIAAFKGDMKSTGYLIEAGVNTKTKNKNGLSPVECAAQHGYTKLTNLYVSKQLAKSKLLTQAKQAKNLAMANGNDDVKITYLGHAGWAMHLNDKVLIIDYWQPDKITEPSLANGNINTKELKGKKVYVLSSHDHNDHYDTTIYTWKKDLANIKYIYGFVPEKSWKHKDKGYHGPVYKYIKDNTTEKIDDMKITTIKSNDTGQGFLIEVDGLKIYHPGDHAYFSAQDEEIFKKEVDLLAETTNQVDVAFLPVTGCPSRWQKEKIVEGFFYTIDKLNPTQVFPMHAFGREHTLKEFAHIGAKKKCKAKITCVENKGDQFTYSKPVTASK